MIPLIYAARAAVTAARAPAAQRWLVSQALPVLGAAYMYAAGLIRPYNFSRDEYIPPYLLDGGGGALVIPTEWTLLSPCSGGTTIDPDWWGRFAPGIAGVACEQGTPTTGQRSTDGFTDRIHVGLRLGNPGQYFSISAWQAPAGTAADPFVPAAAIAVPIHPDVVRRPDASRTAMPPLIPIVVRPYVVPGHIPHRLQKVIARSPYDLPRYRSHEITYGAPRLPVKPYENPAERPLIVPAHVVSARAITRGVSRHQLRKPRKREKERKEYATAGQLKVLRAALSVTEAVDFIDAVYKGVPRALRPRYNGTRFEKRHLNPQEKLKVIYRHADQLDMKAAYLAILTNAAEDFIVGTVAGGASRTLLQSGRMSTRIPTSWE